MSNLFSTLELEVKPGFGLGPFELGSSLWNVFELLRRMQHSFPLVDVKYDPANSPTSPVILHVRPHLDLLFSGDYQRLHTICARALRDVNPRVVLKYKDTVLSSAEEVFRRSGVSRTFGPTYPGEDLRYPGVSFSFEEDGRKAPTLQHDERLQEVRRVFITQKSPNGGLEDGDILTEVLEVPSMHGEVLKAVAKVHDGVDLYFFPSSSEPVQIHIGVTTAQDLTCDLGPPVRVHYKEDDRMSIHSRTTSADEEAETDYFYNYVQHGIDFLVCGSTHVVKKIVLHSNIPGAPLFQRYKRCPWEVEGSPEDNEDGFPSRASFRDRLEDVRSVLTLDETAPPSMLLDRTDEESGLTLPASRTHLVGIDGVVLEVTESAHVTAMTLY